MTEKELQLFKALFSRYCRQEINKGHCAEDSCQLCPVNAAYDEIFHKFAEKPEDEDCDE